LTENYGAFESSGYSCSEADEHNCLQKVDYGLKVCNTGFGEETIYFWELQANNDVCDLLEDVNPEDVMLLPGECYYDTKPYEVNRCEASNYCVNITANATNPITGLPPSCPDFDEIKFEWPSINTLPPTPAPSPFPSPAPSPAPSSTCIIDVELTGCPNYNISLDNNCEGRPQVITFRYNGGGCEQSDNLQPRQKFTCTDTNGGPPPFGSGVQNYIEAVPRGGSDLYFSGPVSVGEKYTLNANKQFDKLSADMTISIFDSQGGSLLQEVNVHLSCSQPLFLFDKFGASQVTSWIETSGREVSDKRTGVETGRIEIGLSADNQAGPVRLLEMTVLTNTQDQPIDYTPQVQGQVLQPGGATLDLPGFEIDIELGQRVSYTFFTTLIGESLDGSAMCNGNDMLECIVGFNLLPVFPTAVPTPRPTITPFPTQDPLTTTCQIGSDIQCSIISPKEASVVGCSNIKASADTCPANAELLSAYLKNTGSSELFMIVTCGKSEFFAKAVPAGESVEFRARASDPCEGEDAVFQTFSSDPELGGSEIASTSVTLSCPGPWTLGNEIVSGFALESYVSTTNNGLSFDFNTKEVELEMKYFGLNRGNIPLTVTSGSIDSPFGSGPIATLPIGVPINGQQLLETQVGNVMLSGASGTQLVFEQSLLGNEDTRECAATSSLQLNL